MHRTLRIMSAVVMLITAACLFAFALTPNFVNSQKIIKAHSDYVRNPNEETKRAYEDMVSNENRVLHLLQYSAGALGVVLVGSVFILLRKKSDLKITEIPSTQQT